MGFIESLLGSGLANAIAFKATADAFNEDLARSDTVNRAESQARTDYRKELLIRGIKANENGKYEEAIHMLIRAIKVDTDYPNGYGLLGISYVDLGQYDNALECYDKCLSLQGKVYVSNDEFIKAIRTLMKMCEEKLGITTSKVRVPVSKNEVNTRKKSTAKRVRTSPKRDTRKSNNRGGNL